MGLAIASIADAQNRLTYIQPVFSSSQIDSLEKVAQSGGAAERISASASLIYVYRKSDAVKAIQFGKEALVFAKNKGSLTEQAGIMCELGKAYDNNNDSYNAIHHFKEALAAAERTADKTLQGIVLDFIGQSYFSSANYPEALRYYLSSYDLLKSINDLQRLSIVGNDIGIVNNFVGNYEAALTYYFQALKIKEKRAPFISISTTLANIGDVYSNLKKYELAESYYKQAMLIAIDDQGKMLIMNKMARAITEQGRIDEAKGYFYSALSTLLHSDYPQFIALNYMNLGRLYVKTGDLDSAYTTFSLALDYYNKYGRQNGKIEAGNQLALVYIKMGKPFQSIKLLSNTLALSEGLKLKDKARETNELLSAAYEKMHNYELALMHRKRADELRDTVYSSQQAAITTALQIQHETEKKNKEIEILTKENEYATSVRNFWLITASFTIGLTLLVYARYYQKKKNLMQLQLKNDEIKAKNTLLQNTTEELKELIATKDKFFSIISHDLKNPFNTIMLISSMIAEEGKNYSPEQVQTFGSDLQRTAANAYKLLENLLEWSQIQRGKVRFTPTQFRITDLITNIAGMLEQAAKAKSIDISVNTPRDYTVIADRNMVELILRNLITNAIKFSHSNSRIEIYVKRESGVVTFKVKDHGIGISDENQKRLFRIEGGFSSRGTAEEPGTGLGLILCKEMAEMNGGSLTVISAEGKGSTFTLTLPSIMNTDSEKEQAENELFIRQSKS